MVDHQEQKEEFYPLLEERIASLDSFKQSSVCIRQETYDKALQLSKGIECSEGNYF